MLNKQQAAEFLGVNVRTLERYTQSGKIGSWYELGKTRVCLGLRRTGVTRVQSRTGDKDL